MRKNRDISRRGFVRICTSALTMLSAHPWVSAREHGAFRPYNRVKLVHADGQDVRLSHLTPGESYVFHYPYVSTPCFLIDLGRSAVPRARLETEDGKTYQWPGGVGPGPSVVAFSAICAHRMSHPAPSISFIGYRHDAARFRDENDNETQRSGVIYCCSEKSVYDPGQGARVLGGPAKQPLASIALSYDEADGCLYATGSTGGEMFDAFFAKFGFRLVLEFKTEWIRNRVAETSTILPLAEYSKTRILC